MLQLHVMGALRALTTGNWRVAFLLLSAALLVRVLVPSGYMFVQRDGLPTVEMCDGIDPAQFEVTYGDYVHRKVGNVFLQLARSTRAGSEA